MSTSTYNRKKRQLHNLAARVNHLILAGEWTRLSAASRNRIIFRLNALCKQLSAFLSYGEMKKILAAAAIFIGIPLVSQAQSFAPPLLNPFGLQPDTTYMTCPVFADIDDDGDLDMFAGNYGGIVEFYQNAGTAQFPLFAHPQADPFGINPIENYYIFPAFADIDDDGDLDLFLGQVNTDREYGADFQFMENTGTPSAPAFAAPVINPFGLIQAYMFSMPEFADIDNDGDMDLFSAEGYGYIKYFENTGTPSEAQFADPVPNPFGISYINIFGSPEFVDIDHDGDLDLFVGEYDGFFQYFQNTGTVSEPDFAEKVTNPFGLVSTYFYNFPAIADLDADGDADIMVGEYYGMFQYFRNTEFNVGIGENQDHEFFSLSPNPATDAVNITLKKEAGEQNTQVTIIDLNGRVIKTALLTTNDLRLKTDDLAPGLYFVRLVQGDKVFTRKMVVR